MELFELVLIILACVMFTSVLDQLSPLLYRGSRKVGRVTLRDNKCNPSSLWLGGETGGGLPDADRTVGVGRANWELTSKGCCIII